MSKKLISHTIIRGYAWWLLKTNLEWDQDNYGGLIPLVPFNDEPKLQIYDRPYIVYGYTESSNGKDHRITTGMLTFTIRSKHLSDIDAATRVLVEGFKREDLSARDLNKFSSDVDEYFDGVNFLCTRVSYAEPGGEQETDGGRIEGIVSVTYEYVDQYGDQPDLGGVVTTASSFSL